MDGGAGGPCQENWRLGGEQGDGRDSDGGRGWDRGEGGSHIGTWRREIRGESLWGAGRGNGGLLGHSDGDSMGGWLTFILIYVLYVGR